MLEALSRWSITQGVDWAALKAGLEPSLNISNDALHVVLGVLVQVAVAWATRSSLGRFMPWLVVLGLTLINEYNDLSTERWPNFATQLGEGTKDIILTMLLPTVLQVLVRKRPRLFRAKPGS